MQPYTIKSSVKDSNMPFMIWKLYQNVCCFMMKAVLWSTMDGIGLPIAHHLTIIKSRPTNQSNLTRIQNSLINFLFPFSYTEFHLIRVPSIQTNSSHVFTCLWLRWSSTQFCQASLLPPVRQSTTGTITPM